MRKNGFTLIELLAVIIILTIILVISIPKITGTINNATKNAFIENAKLVLKAISYQTLNDENFDVTTVNNDTVVNILNLSNANYESVEVTMENDKPYIVIVGANKWDGLTTYGNIENIKVINSEDYDVTPPVITLLGANPVTINRGDIYVDAGAIANDNHDGNITSDIIIVNNVNKEVLGSYTVSYDVSDAFGNEAEEVIRTVNVVDGTKPVITLLGDNPVEIEQGGFYNDAGATALDDVDGDITDKIEVTSTINVNIAGSYTVTYNVGDAAGNEANEVIRTVNVIADSTIYEYTGDIQIFTAPISGTYKLEVWGAQGGNAGYYSYSSATGIGGNGGYAMGNYNLTAGQTIYIYVGGQGGSSVGNYVTCDASDPYYYIAGGWNGGGAGIQCGMTGGGGATDIRTISSTMSYSNYVYTTSSTSLNSRIIVAGGGGGAGNSGSDTQLSSGGAGGGLSGIQMPSSTQFSSRTAGVGGTQTTGYSLGLGSSTNGDNLRGGGGGGYYGGQSGSNSTGGGGGSGYIGGVINGETIAGNVSMPAPAGGTEIGHAGNGYAKITFISSS